jgi:aminoglycoside phosphotransferase (APT) family kinase protein
MADEPDENALRRLVHSLEPGAKLLRAWTLTGGVSARLTALEIENSDSAKKKLVVRQHGEADRKRNPRIAVDEFKLLQLLQEEGVAVPMPYYLDDSCQILPAPYLVIEYIEGKPEFHPPDLPRFTDELAAHLARIHTVAASHPGLAFLPSEEERLAKKLAAIPATLDDTLSEGLIRDALERAWPFPQHNREALLHGDYWPGNILWDEGRLLAIIDWEDAALGDPLADLGNSRLEILWAFGKEAMNQFTHRYQSITGLDFTSLPHWDLAAALRPASRLSTWGLDPATEQAMRDAHRWFVEQALAML